MIEIPLVGLLLIIMIAGAGGLMIGQVSEGLGRDGRRKRALAKVTPVWEVHVGSDSRDYGHGVFSSGDHVVISVRKVRRSGRYYERLQEIEVARVRGDGSPEKILDAVDRAREMVSTLALAGAA